MTNRGRPKEFDREDALEKAMELFWERGYAATGLRDLLDHMGIGRQSLYDTFGDKQQLFEAAVRHYGHRVTHGLCAELHGPGAPLQRIRKVIKSVGDAATDGRCRGCLLTNTLVEAAPHDGEIAQLAATILTTIERSFRRTLEDAVLAGELPKDANVRALARFFTSSVQGLIVMGKASVSRAVARDIVNVTLSVLD